MREGGAVGFRVLLVARRDVVAADHHLAGLAGGSSRPSSAMIATSGPAATPTLPPLRLPGGKQVRGHLVGGLGHAVGFDHRAAEGLFQLGHHLRRQRGRGGADEAAATAAAIASGLRAARARIAWCMVGTAVYQLGFASLEPGEEAQRVEARRAVDAAAGGERRQHRRDQPVDVEERHDVEAAVVRP